MLLCHACHPLSGCHSEVHLDITRGTCSRCRLVLDCFVCDRVDRRGGDRTAAFAISMYRHTAQLPPYRKTRKH